MSVPASLTSMFPNTARLMHMRRPCPYKLCATCCNSCAGQTHWRVRAHILSGGESRHDLEYACSEACARVIYDRYKVEISLITDVRTLITKYR